MKISETLKKLLFIPYYYQAEVTHQTIVMSADTVLDVSKYNCSSISFAVPANTGATQYDTVKIKHIPLVAGDPMISFNSGIPNIDKTKYEISFQGLAGTQKVLYIYITTVNKYMAHVPSQIQDCDK